MSGTNVVGTLDVQAKYFELDIVVPPTTPLLSTPLALGNRRLETIDVYWPPGNAGRLAVQFTYQGLQFLPYGNVGGFLLGNDERRIFDVGLEVNGAIVVTITTLPMLFDHTLYVLAKTTELLSPTAAVTAPLLNLTGTEAP